jgi:hypothetical protein
MDQVDALEVGDVGKAAAVNSTLGDTKRREMMEGLEDNRFGSSSWRRSQARWLDRALVWVLHGATGWFYDRRHGNRLWPKKGRSEHYHAGLSAGTNRGSIMADKEVISDVALT